MTTSTLIGKIVTLPAGEVVTVIAVGAPVKVYDKVVIDPTLAVIRPDFGRDRAILTRVVEALPETIRRASFP